MAEELMDDHTNNPGTPGALPKFFVLTDEEVAAYSVARENRLLETMAALAERYPQASASELINFAKAELVRSDLEENIAAISSPNLLALEAGTIDQFEQEQPAQNAWAQDGDDDYVIDTAKEDYSYTFSTASDRDEEQYESASDEPEQVPEEITPAPVTDAAEEFSAPVWDGIDVPAEEEVAEEAVVTEPAVETEPETVVYDVEDDEPTYEVEPVQDVAEEPASEVEPVQPAVEEPAYEVYYDVEPDHDGVYDTSDQVTELVAEPVVVEEPVVEEDSVDEEAWELPRAEEDTTVPYWGQEEEKVPANVPVSPVDGHPLTSEEILAEDDIALPLPFPRVEVVDEDAVKEPSSGLRPAPAFEEVEPAAEGEVADAEDAFATLEDFNYVAPAQPKTTKHYRGLFHEAGQLERTEETNH